MPLQKQTKKEKLQGFEKESFQYDQAKDCYVCPEGHFLSSRFVDTVKKCKVYKITDCSLCLTCDHFNTCTTNKQGRKISRLINEEAREKIKTEYEQPESQDIYKLRKERVELPFGHIKRNLKADAFYIRGRDGANAEISLLASCFNIASMITILGIPKLIESLVK